MSLRSPIGGSSPSSLSESTAALARRLVADKQGQAGEVPRLVVEGGPSHGQELRLDKLGQPYRIGRSVGCHLVVPDDDMSREHAEIERRWDGIFVRDLESKNGVLLHGKRLARECRLADGDRVEMGQTLLVLDDPGDRRLRQLQDGTAPTAAADPGLSDTHTAVHGPGRLAGVGQGLSSNPAVTGRVRASTLLVIATVVLVAAIGWGLSFLLAR